MFTDVGLRGSLLCGARTPALQKLLPQFRTILGLDQANLGKNTEINKQSHVKFWFNRKKYGAVSIHLAVLQKVAENEASYLAFY